jgi:hypothetical protein
VPVFATTHPGKNASGLTVLGESLKTVCKILLRSNKFARPGIPPRCEHDPKAKSNFAFFRNKCLPDFSALSGPGRDVLKIRV